MRMLSTWPGQEYRPLAHVSRIALKHATTAEGFQDDQLDVHAFLRDIIATQNKQIQDMQAWLQR